MKIKWDRGWEKAMGQPKAGTNWDAVLGGLTMCGFGLLCVYLLGGFEWL